MPYRRKGTHVAPIGDVRVAAIADLHFSKTSAGLLQPMLSQIATAADMLVIAGDLTDYGLAEEARLLVKDLSASVRLPIIAVLGNHDYESGAEQEIRQILIDGGIVVLDGDAHVVEGIGFAGVKGFAGGFGRGVLGPWGEQTVKMFVHEAVSETLKLESALARLRTEKKVVVLHYAPIQATVEGEPREIFPYLGCGRLEEPLGRYGVTCVFHGHAHKGSLEGRSSTNIPVYNVALPLLRRTSPEQPFKVLEI
jgi:Icc-related predicted phosphoesterase